jgi:2-methylisocitrate lyase-like PEP mutase family enzyme
LVLNARVDTFISGEMAVATAVERGNAYLAAGADCIYPIEAPADAIRPLTQGIAGPVNILFGPESPGLDELEQLGVARVSFGTGLAVVALTAAMRVASRALER